MLRHHIGDVVPGGVAVDIVGWLGIRKYKTFAVRHPKVQEVDRRGAHRSVQGHIRRPGPRGQDIGPSGFLLSATISTYCVNHHEGTYWLVADPTLEDCEDCYDAK